MELLDFSFNMDAKELAKAENEALEVLKSDPDCMAEIKKLGLTKGEVKANISILLDLHRDKEYCRHCPGLEKCDKARRNMVLSVERTPDGLNPQIDICPLLEMKKKEDKRYIDSSFPLQWRKNTLKDIDQTGAKRDLIMDFVKAVGGFCGKWFYLTGERNRGRSFSLACFANDYCDKKDASVSFIDSASLIKNLSDTYYASKDRTKFENSMKKYEEADLLILDDFGSEFVSEFVFSTIIYPLLNERAKNGLITCFTSDFTLDEVVSLYAGKLGPLRGKQIGSLLKGLCKEYTLNGVALY